MSKFGSYILQFVKDTDTYQTHLSFNRGKYNVPDEHFDKFYKHYFEAMQAGEELFLIEKIHNSKFRFFLDIDAPKQTSTQLVDKDIKSLVQKSQEVICQITGGDKTTAESIVSKRSKGKYHVNFPNIVVNSSIAKVIFEEIRAQADEKIKECLDISVYRTGLRLLGSKKRKVSKTDQDEVYYIYNLDSQTFDKTPSFDNFMQTIIRVKSDTQLREIQEKYKSKVTDSSSNKTANVPVRGVENAEVVKEIVELFGELKATNECLSTLDTTIERIYATQNKMGLFCYYVSIKHRVCPFKDREHQRTSSPLYIEIGLSGVFVKCYDQECLRRKFPDTGVKLPDDFETKYKQLYLSMSTKYWKTDVKLTDEVKRYLEDSLAGSHYQIAKAVFHIYKDRFRVDDVKNTAWYEYDGIRWKKSHLINILISEEMPKYYRGIKVSDTSIQSADLKEYLVNDEKIDANMRNQMVDNIIHKLENVTFKNNVLNQITYLFKNYDPDFYTLLDSNPYLCGFKNGAYDFKQNTFRKSVQSDYLTFSTGYDYIEYDENNVQIKEIYDFLSKIITNQKVREYLLKVLGKALVGIPEEKFYIWTGISGANGKSTLVNFLEATLGDYTTSVDVSLLTNRRGNASNASPDIIRLRGKRMFSFQEPEHDDKLRTGILKQYTGGDTIIARELFKAPVSFKLQGTMIMCCNDLPTVASIDGGTWRRIRVIEFKSRFCDNPVKENEFKIDPSIKYKMQEWRPYFMSILIHWYNKYLYEGLNEPDEVKKATAKYKNDNDKFNEFFDQCLEESDTFESNKSIYSNFQSWWVSNYPSAKVPEIRDLRRAMKIKYGNEIEKAINGMVNYGFNMRIKYNTDDISYSTDDL